MISIDYRETFDTEHHKIGSLNHSSTWTSINRLVCPHCDFRLTSFQRECKLRIAFFCAPSAEPCWSESSSQSGIGGSEEAVIRMAELLAERGHAVEVYNAPARPTSWEGGVRY